MSAVHRFESYLLLAIPTAGLGIVILFQIGQYLALGVPIEFLELDPVRTLLSALTIALFATASLTMLAVFYQREDTNAKKYRYLYHLGAVTVVTLPFWSGEIGLKSKIDWAVLTYIFIVSLITLRTHSYVDQLTGRVPYMEPKATKVYDFAAMAFWNLAIISLSTVALGGFYVRQDRDRTVLAGTNLVFVGQYNGMFVFKDVSQTPAGEYVHSGVTLLPTGNRIALENKSGLKLKR